MSNETLSLHELVHQDPRYPLDAYMFVSEAHAYAADSMELGMQTYDCDPEPDSELYMARRERHLTGQQLCEAIREYALNQFGYMAKIVLKSWGIEKTSCFGDIVYNMINVGIMKKSSWDERSHFDGVYEFDEAFQSSFEICDTLANKRS